MATRKKGAPKTAPRRAERKRPVVVERSIGAALIVPPPVPEAHALVIVPHKTIAAKGGWEKFVDWLTDLLGPDQ